MNTDNTLIETITDTNTRPHFSPEPDGGKPLPLYMKQRGSTKGVPGAFGKAKNAQADFFIKNRLVELLNKAKKQIQRTGEIHEVTAKQIDRIAGDGAARIALKRLSGKKEA